MLYCVVVAGKSADFTDAVMGRLLKHAKADETPFVMIRRLLKRKGKLEEVLQQCRTGNYTKMAKAFAALAKSSINLTSCLPEQLETIPGIGPKTSRFFIIWTRPGARYAALDVHVLRWLGKQGYKVPKSTPIGKRYAELEQAFLAEADRFGLSPGDLDVLVWTTGAGRLMPERISEG